MGHEVIVANPRQLGLIFGSRRKNDERDAEHQARLGRMDPRLLCPIQHRSNAAQKGLLTIKARKALVATRTRLVTAIRALAKSFGHRVSKADAAYFVRRTREELPPEMLEALEPLCATLESLQEQIAACDAAIEQLGSEGLERDHRAPPGQRGRPGDRAGLRADPGRQAPLSDEP